MAGSHQSNSRSKVPIAVVSATLSRSQTRSEAKRKPVRCSKELVDPFPKMPPPDPQTTPMKKGHHPILVGLCPNFQGLSRVQAASLGFPSTNKAGLVQKGWARRPWRHVDSAKPAPKFRRGKRPTWRLQLTRNRNGSMTPLF